MKSFMPALNSEGSEDNSGVKQHKTHPRCIAPCLHQRAKSKLQKRGAHKRRYWKSVPMMRIGRKPNNPALNRNQGRNIPMHLTQASVGQPVPQMTRAILSALEFRSSSTQTTPRPPQTVCSSAAPTLSATLITNGSLIVSLLSERPW